MKIFMLCVFVLLNYVIIYTHAWERAHLGKYGQFKKALYSKYSTCDHDKTTNLDVRLVDVYYYDFSKNVVKSFPIAEAADGILSMPNLDIMRRFIIFVDGYNSTINDTAEERVRHTFRDFPNSYLIILDHSPYTNDKNGPIISYKRSVQYVYYVGRALGEMLASLRSGGISAKNMHCIGHSLGGQLLGYTGQIFFEATGTKLWRITALDPAGPCFSNSVIEDQVRSGVAEYVEVYHCNAGGLGSSSVLGDIDFFMNKKGEFQPNCGTTLLPDLFDSPKSAYCSHMMCLQVWTVTIKHPDWFLAWKCDSYKMFKNGECAANDVTLAGFWNPGNATGVYYLSTEGYDMDIRNYSLVNTNS